MLQLIIAARYQGLSARFRRWAYQANVMKMLESSSRPAVRMRIELTGNNSPCWWLLPSQPRAKRGYVGHMVPAMLGVQGQHLLQPNATVVLGVPKTPAQLLRSQRAQQEDPAPVQALEQGERGLYRRGLYV